MISILRLFSQLSPKRLAARLTALRAALWLVPLLALASVTDARAAFTMYLYESGGNVVASGSGSLNTSGAGCGPTGTQVIKPSPGGMLYTGGTLGSNAICKIYSLSGPATFGTGETLVSANSSSGTYVAIGFLSLGVASTYVSGTQITSGAVFNGKTLAGLGVTCGTYVWTWGSGTDADSYTLEACTAPPPPPTVTSVSPSSGSIAGGTSITINGTNFTGATSISVGGTACASFTVIDDTTATCTTPVGSAGTASVLVTTPSGTNAANTLFTYAIPTFTIGGSVSGLGANKSVVLQNNTANDLTVSANGAFAFTTAIDSGTAYAVTIKTQPEGQQCVVTDGTGTVGSAAVTNVSIQCFDRSAVSSPGSGISGTVSATITGGTCAGFDAQAVRFDPVANPPANTGNFAYGVFGFTVKSCGSGGTVTITLKYPQVLPAGTRYWKQINGNWVDWTNKVTIQGDSVILTIADGGEGDTNPNTGEISDPSGPALPAAVAGEPVNVPTLSEWVMLLLAGLIGIVAFGSLRRRMV